MGVGGLLKAVADVRREVHVAEYRGMRVGLDSYCLLHRGARAMTLDMLAGRQNCCFFQPLLATIKLMLAHGVTPVPVFDGGVLVAKTTTEAARQQARKDCLRSTRRRHSNLHLPPTLHYSPLTIYCLTK